MFKEAKNVALRWLPITLVGMQSLVLLYQVRSFIYFI